MKDLDIIFGELKEGILICDKDSKISYCNKSYLNFIGKSMDEVRGKYLRDIRPGAQQPEVIRNGKPVFGALRKEEGEEYFVNMYPMFDKGEVVGGISVVTFLKNANTIKEGIEEVERRQRYLDRRIRETNGAYYTFDDIISISPSSIETKNIAKKIAKRDVDVLIEGESGTGKELYAQSIHNESPRGSNPFIAVNCSTFPKDILESELFGYEEGTFTGALKGGKIGLFESANHGTIFLDEISEMDMALQAKLLRVLQEKKIRRVGGREEIPIDVRIISACNVNLKDYIKEGKFRQDLYYRIAVIPITILPLRDRKEDIAPLTDHFIKRLNVRLKKNFTLTEGAKNLLYAYDWPGNIRELKNVMEFSAVMTQDEVLDEYNFPPRIIDSKYLRDERPVTLDQRTREFEKKEIERTLRNFPDTVEGKKKAAKALGISLATLYNKLNF